MSDVNWGKFRSGSADIYYELHGNGEEVLVLLHGNGGSIENFKNQIPFFEKYYTVLAIDSRGHGQSGFGRDELSLGKMSVDVENIVKHLGYKSVNVLGFSDGANIAMLLGIRNNIKIDKLVLVGGNYNFWGLTFSAAAMIYAGYISACATRLVDKGAQLNKELFAIMVKEPKLKKEALEVINAKTLVINGNRDMIRVKHAKDIADAIPNSELKIVKGDHFYLFKEYESFNRLVLGFLRGEAK